MDMTAIVPLHTNLEVASVGPSKEIIMKTYFNGKKNRLRDI